MPSYYPQYDRDDFSQRLHVGDIYRIVTENDDIAAQAIRGHWLPAYQKDFGALTGGTESRDNQDTNLQVPTNSLAIYRFFPLDYFETAINQPANQQLWKTKDSGGQFKISPWNLMDDKTREQKLMMWRASEFWVWEDEDPRFHFLNSVSGGSGAIQAYVEFSGYKWDMERLTQYTEEQKMNIPFERQIFIHTEIIRGERVNSARRLAPGGTPQNHYPYEPVGTRRAH